MQNMTQLPEPSSKHATCAWCAAEHTTVIELIDHVDTHHLTDKPDIESVAAWTPTADDVAAIIAGMRPIIARAARDQERVSAWTKAAAQFTVQCERSRSRLGVDQ